MVFFIPQGYPFILSRMAIPFPGGAGKHGIRNATYIHTVRQGIARQRGNLGFFLRTYIQTAAAHLYQADSGGFVRIARTWKAGNRLLHTFSPSIYWGRWGMMTAAMT